MTNQCQHGQLARVCVTCEQAAEIATLRAEVAGLRAELLKSLADNAALRADAIDRQNNVVAPLRAEAAGLREFVEHVRRNGSTHLANMAVAVLAARKSTTPTTPPPSPSPRS